ncbi:hypothetical protein RGUI_2111 [Rhodovulum sp. P5]|nr:hypothetical protein RGUI_2111 [Rhodovulum sp. P5]
MARGPRLWRTGRHGQEIVIPVTGCKNMARRARKNMSTTSVDKFAGNFGLTGIFPCFS